MAGDQKKSVTLHGRERKHHGRGKRKEKQEKSQITTKQKKTQPSHSAPKTIHLLLHFFNVFAFICRYIILVIFIDSYFHSHISHFETVNKHQHMEEESFSYSSSGYQLATPEALKHCGVAATG